MDYNVLIAPKSTPGSIADWVNDSRIAGDAPFIIEEAMSNIFATLRHWKMQAPPITGTLQPGDTNFAWPSDMIEPFYLALTGQNKQEISQVTPQECFGRMSYDAQGNRTKRRPMVYYFDSQFIQLDAPADIAYPYMFSYFQRPAALTADNPTNFILTDFIRLARAAIMVVAVEWLKESGQGQFDRTYWLQVYTDQLTRAQAASDRAHRATIGNPVMIGGPAGFMW